MANNVDPQAFLSALPVPAILVDGERRVLAVNDAAQRALNVAPPGNDLARSVRVPELLEAVDGTLADGKKTSRELQMGSAPPLTYEITVSPIEIAGARCALIIFIDLTSARQADAARSAFVANVSHELRSPLTSLMGAAEALEGPAQDDPEGRKRMLALMGQEARRMKNLIDDLLSLSRVEAQEFIPPGQDVALAPLLEGARERLADRAAAREIEIELHMANDLPKVPGVDDELFQVFDNLISNAIKYGDRNSAVTVSANEEGSDVSITIHNAGPAIAPEHLPRLTERFYRIDKSRSRELGGTGLGLAIVKHIVSRHRGRLLIDSAENEGTTFTLLLPASR